MPPIGSFQNIEQGLDFLQLIFGHRVFTGEVELGLELFPIILRHLLAGLLKGEDRHLTIADDHFCLLYTSPSPRDRSSSRMPSSA